MKKVTQFLAILLMVTSIVSCKKSETVADPNVVFKATINAASEVPTNTSTASGLATLTYNTTTKIFTVSLTYTGLTPTAGHIHKGAVGVSGGVIFGFTGLASPFSYTSVALDATQEADLMAGLYYVNLHTTTYAGGEIRGQLIKQ